MYKLKQTTTLQTIVGEFTKTIEKTVSFEYLRKHLIWIDKTGTETVICKLNESHLKNIIKALETIKKPHSLYEGLTHGTWLHIMEQELAFRKITITYDEFVKAQKAFNKLDDKCTCICL